MPQWLIRLLRWVRLNPARATIVGIILALVASGLLIWDDIHSIEGGARVTYSVPPAGSNGGTYAYRVTAPPGNNAKVQWVQVDNIVSTAPHNAMTTEQRWGTSIHPVTKIVEGSGSAVPDVGLQFDVPSIDASYTLIDLTASIKYDYTILWTTFNLGFELHATVPGPWNLANTAPQLALPAPGLANAIFPWTAEQWYPGFR